MAEEVVKTIENVDRLFSEIVVNGEVHRSENYVPPVTIGQTTVPASSSTEEEQSTSPAQTVVGADVYAVELNDILHNFSDQEVSQALQAEIETREDIDEALQEDVSTIQGMIPNQASSENKLADKNFVNSSIATNTANFLGTYSTLTEIEAIPNPTNNDYAFLATTDSAGNTLYDRYKYNADDDEWLFEYEINNSGFTAEQWATINSGLTQSSVDQDIADAIAQLPVGSKITVSANTTLTPNGDIIAFVDTAGVTLTLNFGSSERGKAEIYALANCTVSYYTDANTVASLSMSAGTSATLIYFNGWKFNGVYGAVWN